MRLSWPIVVLCGLLISIMFIPQDVARSYISALLQWISGLGWAAPVVLATIHIVAVVFCFPATILFEWAAGFLFGLYAGVLLVTFSKTLGGSLGFVAGRTMLRDWVAEKLASHPSFQNALQTMKEDGGWKLAFLLRVSPVPSWTCTYGLAITSVTFPEFVGSTLIGSLPMIVQNVYLGSLFLSLTDTNPEAENSWVQTLLFALMIVSTIFIFKYIMKYLVAPVQEQAPEKKQGTKSPGGKADRKKHSPSCT